MENLYEQFLKSVNVAQDIYVACIHFVNECTGENVSSLTLDDAWQTLGKKTGYAGKADTGQHGTPYIQLTVNDFKGVPSTFSSKELVKQMYQDFKSDQQKKVHAKKTGAAIFVTEYEKLSASGDSDYLKRKQVPSCPGIRYHDKFIAIPMMDKAGTIKNVQKIFNGNDGKKRFGGGAGTTKGYYFVIKDADTTAVLDKPYLCEGLATGLTAFMAGVKCVYVAFNAHNMVVIANMLKELHCSNFVVIADNDYGKSDKNPGLSAAKRICAKHNVKYIIPPEIEGEKAVDLNDLFCAQGIDAVITCLSREIEGGTKQEQQLKISTQKLKSIEKTEIISEGPSFDVPKIIDVLASIENVYIFKGWLHILETEQRQGYIKFNPLRLSGAILSAMLHHHIKFSVFRKDGEVEVDIKKTYVDIIGHSLPAYLTQFRVVDRLLKGPFFTETGEFISDNGYYENSKVLLLNANPLGVVDSSKYTPESAINYIFNDFLPLFPFAEASDKANALALLILPFVRSLVHGPTPLHLVEATTQGTGKTLLATMLCGVFATPEITAPPTKAEEWDKKLSAIFMTDPMHIFFDNLTKKLENADFAGMLTSITWSTRVLGYSVMSCTEIPVVWVLTANNAELSADFPRRSVRISLDANTENPENRDISKQPDINQWLQNNRTNVVSAMKAIVDNWFSLGRPEPTKAPILGSFEAWRHVIGGILESAGVEGFLEDKLIKENDGDREIWRGFVKLWYSVFRLDPITTKQFHSLGIECGIFDELLPGKSDDSSQRTRITRGFSKIRGSVLSGFKLIGGRVSGGAFYKLEKIEDIPSTIERLTEHAMNGTSYEDDTFIVMGQENKENENVFLTTLLEIEVAEDAICPKSEIKTENDSF
ncbi:MAG: hypothetical protein KAH77_10385 [Thiomargarita sp.]|nr:hypothetical protein [Thiomargarita sp.]